jgi:DNA (cytosine-5)-methyltransferase 1
MPSHSDSAASPSLRPRELLKATGLPWVIENVPRAPLYGAVQLCGTAFGLGGPDWDLQRHRLFECSFPLRPTGCFHDKPAISVVGHGATKATRERLGRNPLIAEKRAAMGIDWMNRDELSEAIPPVYTEYVGAQLLAHIRKEDAAYRSQSDTDWTKTEVFADVN